MDRLAPWDALPYYLTPLYNTVLPGSPPGLIAPGDPNRVLLVITSVAGPATFLLTPDPNDTTGGIPTSAALPPVIIDYDRWGVFTTMAWFAPAAANNPIWVAQLSLAKPLPQSDGGSADDGVLQRSADDIGRYNRYLARWAKSAEVSIGDWIAKYQPGNDQLQRGIGVGPGDYRLSRRTPGNARF